MSRNTKRVDGVTYHRCARCKCWFAGTGRCGRPFRKCAACAAAEQGA